MSDFSFHKNANDSKGVAGTGYLNNHSGVFTFEIMTSERMASPGILPFYKDSTRRITPSRIGDVEFVPLGNSNSLPDELRALLDENNIGPELLRKKAGLQWGQGPALYRTEFDAEGKRKKIFVSNPEIENWLKSWDYESYLLKAITEYEVMEGHFTRYHLNKGPRIGAKAFIAKLENVSHVRGRLGWYNKNLEITYLLDGDFDRPWLNGVTVYPVFDPLNPFRYQVSMRYSNLPNFALENDYSRPSFYGGLNWMKTSNSIAKILNYFNLNTAAIKWHITSPSAYWEHHRELLMQRCIENPEKYGQYSDDILDKFKQDKIAEISKALTGIDKVGKAVHTEEIFDQLSGSYVGWKFTAIDPKIKDYIDAQINISKRAAFETTAAFGLHPALSNLSADGNLPSGSEQLYAFKLYLMTSTDIPESIICKDINFAIQSNFPNTELKLGFYHDVVITEEATSSKNRIKNN